MRVSQANESFILLLCELNANGAFSVQYASLLPSSRPYLNYYLTVLIYILSLINTDLTQYHHAILNMLIRPFLLYCCIDFFFFVFVLNKHALNAPYLIWVIISLSLQRHSRTDERERWSQDTTFIWRCGF